MTNAIVSPSDDGWKVHVEGRSRASVVSPTQKEAIDRAKEIVGNNGGGEVSIQGLNGKIREKDTVRPGSDPKNIPG